MKMKNVTLERALLENYVSFMARRVVESELNRRQLLGGRKELELLKKYHTWSPIGHGNFSLLIHCEDSAGPYQAWLMTGIWDYDEDRNIIMDTDDLFLFPLYPCSLYEMKKKLEQYNAEDPNMYQWTLENLLERALSLAQECLGDKDVKFYCYDSWNYRDVGNPNETLIKTRTTGATDIEGDDHE